MLKLYFLIVIFLISCTKQSDEPVTDCSPSAIPTLRIREVIHYEGSDTTYSFTEKFSYDKQGRITTRVMVFPGYTDTTEVYSYEPGKVIRNSDEYTLDDRGLVASKGNSVFWTYNGEGYLVQRIAESSGARDTLRFEYRCFDRVLTRGSGVDPEGPYRYEITYEYVPGSRNSIGDNNKGILFFGRQNNSLLRKYTEPDLYSQEFTYSFDPQGRVSWLRINTCYGTIMFQEVIYEGQAD